ncbi:MAG TPA: hypothetical protein VEP71_02920 [Gallionella sp.]|nr:hypothetical protein [Gallionella sp.]
MGKTTELRREIKRTFVPFVEARGFKMDQRYAPQFLEFRRIVGDELHVFDIQWGKNGSRRFVVNFGKCPSEGVEFHGQIIPAEGINPAHCASSGRLQPGKGAALWNWFRQDKPLLKRLLSREPFYPAQSVIDQLIAMFPEIEAYWEQNEIGPHLRVFEFRKG